MTRHAMPLIAIVLTVVAMVAWHQSWSELTLIVALAAWILGASWAATRWPGETAASIPDATEHWGQFVRFRRKVIVAGGAMALALVWNQADAQLDRCEARSRLVADVRAGIGSGVDEVADYAALTPRERLLVVERVRDRVAEDLPPPSC